MSRYVVLYCAPQEVAARFALASPAEAQAGVARWAAWAEKLGPALVDPGHPLGNPARVTTEGVTASDSTVVGMSILDADTRDQALSFVTDHHHLAWSEECEIILLEEQVIPELQ